MKKWIAMLLALILILSVLPPVSAAEDQTPETEDIWTVITRIEDLAAGCAKADSAQSRSAAYAACTDLIISAVENSENFVPGSIVRHGDFFYWDETDGTACGYSPRLRAQIRESADPDADPEAFSGIETVSYAGKGGYPSSINVAAFQPYIGIDGSFTAQYENRCNSLAPMPLRPALWCSSIPTATRTTPAETTTRPAPTPPTSACNRALASPLRISRPCRDPTAPTSTPTMAAATAI